jgi:transcriptional regulator with XRE-family HTH domain
MKGTRLRERRQARGLTQLQLARHLHVAPNTVARWERNERAIPATVVRLLTIEREATAEQARLEAEVRRLGERLDLKNSECVQLRTEKKVLSRELTEGRTRWSEDRARWRREIMLFRTQQARMRRFLSGDWSDWRPGPGVYPTGHDVYTRLVQKYHSDRNPQHAAVMSDINELWQAINRK